VTRRIRAVWPILAFFAAFTAVSAPVWAQGTGASEGLTESLLRVKLARGVDLNLLVSQRTGTQATIAALLFAGYPGILKLREEEGKVVTEMGGNFLIRARRFLNTDQVFTVAVDCPADQQSTCGDLYRSSAQHVADIAEVVVAIKQNYAARQVYLVGTSYGTVSTSFLALGLGQKIDGAVHTATMTDTPRRAAHGLPMASFDWSAAQPPQLFIHHKDDPCAATSYASVVARRKDIPLITVQGAVDPRGDPCQARTQHGFVGRERVVMAALHDWLTARKVPAVVGAADSPP
jgi:pimeloyl-ACP methyl ester carboxylesterase